MLEGVRADWRDAPADALEASELYEGVRMRRSVAFLIDVLLLAVLAVIWWVVGGLLTFISLGLLQPLLILGSVLLPFAYHTLFIGGDGAATPGMRAMRLRVVATDGAPPSYLQAFIMTALFYFSIGATTWLILLISLFNPRGRCLHDYLAAVLVVRADARPQVSYAVR